MWLDELDTGWELVTKHGDPSTHRALRRINRNLIRIGRVLERIERNTRNMASDIANDLNGKFDTIEATLRNESAEIQQAIADAAAGGLTPEELAALNARADGINAAIAALVTAPAPPAP